MVSNTASYLRLWALSLAHTELATVFWEKAMLTTINSGNPVAIVAGYAIFAGVTFAVLIVMDVLECFLHALRLHWVSTRRRHDDHRPARTVAPLRRRRESHSRGPPGPPTTHSAHCATANKRRYHTAPTRAPPGTLTTPHP